MRFTQLFVLAAPSAVGAQTIDLLTDINKISRYWGQISPYADNPENYFGIDYVGLPDGCQIVRSLPKSLPNVYTNLGISANSPTPCPALPYQWRGRWRKRHPLRKQGFELRLKSQQRIYRTPQLPEFLCAAIPKYRLAYRTWRFD